MQLLRECAERNGRTLAEELRLAAELHVTTALLWQLADPEVRKKLGREADDVERRTREKLAALAERAYRARPHGLLEDLIWINAKVAK